MELPNSPRTDFEARYFMDTHPCETCGQTGVTDLHADYAQGQSAARCAKCGIERRFTWTPAPHRKLPPPFELGPGASQVFSAAQLRVSCDRALSRVPLDPTTIATVKDYDQARIALVAARTAIVELAKLTKGDAAVAAEAEALARLYETYVAAEATVHGRPGAQPKPIGLDGRFSQHRKWLARGKKGDGQLVFRGEKWSGLRMGTPLWDDAIVEDTILTRIDLSYGEFKRIKMLRARLLGCNLTACKLEDAQLDSCDLRGSSLAMGHLLGVVVNGGDWSCVFAGRGLWTSRFIGVDLHEANLRDCRLDGSTLERCDLRKVDFSRDNKVLTTLGTARGTRFVECDLRGANVAGWRLDGAVFERCKMHGQQGQPAFEGAPTLVLDADLSPNADGSARRSEWLR